MRHLLGVAALMLLLSACGSGGDVASDEAGAAGHSASPSGTTTEDVGGYFRQADSTAINEVAGPAQAAIRKATTRQSSCNRFRAYPTWRRCWHGLLDPVVKGLDRTAEVFQQLAGHDLPDKCVELLREASDRFRGSGRTVAGELAAIDGDDYAAQKRAVNRTTTALRRAQAVYSTTFVPMTRACYSPAALASISASPSESGSP